MTDDTQQYRNATEDELGAVTTAGLTVHEWILIGNALVCYITEPVDFDLTAMMESGKYDGMRGAVEYAERFVKEQNRQAERIMDVGAAAIISATPIDTREHQHMMNAVSSDDPWFGNMTAEMIVMPDIDAAQAAARLN